MNIRKEMPEDHQAVEELTRRAFYNMYIPGAVEHYLVHIMREHEDFIPELDLVAEISGRIVGSIMYTKAWLRDENGEDKEILTFGPLCVDPDYQRRGIGKQLMARSFSLAEELGYDTVVIFGSPSNYVSSGFCSCRKYEVHAEGGSYPAAMLVKELKPGALSGHSWTYRDSPVMAINEDEARAYDDTLPTMERSWQPSQEEFYILSQAVLT